MCHHKETDICTGDCNNCTGPVRSSAANLGKRIQQLTRTVEPEHTACESIPLALNQDIKKDIL